MGLISHSTKILKIKRVLYQLFKFKRSGEKAVVFIMGCQRSGTTMLIKRIFYRDLNTRIYGEYSKLSSDDIPEKIRLNPLPSVKKVIDEDKMPLVILKPIVESQNSQKLLDFFEGSKVIWLYRDYKDVVASNLKIFGMNNGIDDLRAIVEDHPGNWRSENVPEDIRALVKTHYAEDMNPYDAAALFWYVRNSIFFQLGFEANPSVMIYKYSDLVETPLESMKKMYKFIGREFPGEKIVSEVHSKSMGRGREVQLSENIEELCENLLKKLDDVYHSKAYSAD